MTLHLAIDTATSLGTVAVGPGGGAPLAEVTFGERRHAASAAPAVEEALRLAGVSWSDLGGIVLADGPGSFTGLRIGAALAQGFLRARESLSLATAPSLLAAAWTASCFYDGPIAALYDALRGEIFAAVYRIGTGGVEILLPPTLTRIDALRQRPDLRPLVAVGDGAFRHSDAVMAWTGRKPVAPPVGAPRASALLQLLGIPGACRAVPVPAEFEPDYGRAAEAQVRWERAHGRSLPNSPRDLS